MNLSFKIARRYLFSKKSHNAVNIISLISVCGVLVATAAMLILLSVFNGFTDIAAKSFGAMDPELKIVSVKGKVFSPTGDKFEKIGRMQSIELISQSLEENAMLMFGDKQETVLLKGVSPEYKEMVNSGEWIINGEYALREGDIDFVVAGIGLAGRLRINPRYITPMYVYMPKRNAKVNMMNPAGAFSSHETYLSGVFSINQAKYDDNLLIVSIDLARELLDYDTQVTSLDLKLKRGALTETVEQEIQNLLGEDFEVQNRFEQQSDIYKIVETEKTVVYLILTLVLIVAVFNVVGSLTLLILEKNEDIGVLRSMGANKKLISSIFLYEGLMISLSGTALGIILGLAICLVQEYFGVLGLGSSPGVFVVDSYPVVVEWTDILIVFFTVSVVSISAVLYPISNLRKRLDATSNS